MVLNSLHVKYTHFQSQNEITPLLIRRIWVWVIDSSEYILTSKWYHQIRKQSLRIVKNGVDLNRKSSTWNDENLIFVMWHEKWVGGYDFFTCSCVLFCDSHLSNLFKNLCKLHRLKFQLTRKDRQTLILHNLKFVINFNSFLWMLDGR